MRARTLFTVTLTLEWEGNASEETVHDVVTSALIDMAVRHTKIAEAGDSEITIEDVNFPANPEDLTY